jgi:hypothetical protein
MLLGKARSMLIGSGLPNNVWVEAVRSVAYLLNRSPLKTLEIVTPAEKWYGIRPDLSKFKGFGIVAYLHKPRSCKHGSLIADLGKCFMVGYCQNGYRLWCPV